MNLAFAIEQRRDRETRTFFLVLEPYLSTLWDMFTAF